MMSLSVETGTLLVKYARNVIESHLTGSSVHVPSLDVLSEDRGVFVTLEKGGELRGCIGFPEPVYPLGEAVGRAAVSAATEDPRFPGVSKDELSGIAVEVSVLTKPEEVHVDAPEDYVSEVVVGRDGLIAEKGWSRGLLLPQVPVQWGWDSRQFISQTCVKAGMEPDAWLGEGFKLYRFTAQVFCEKEPLGDVAEKDLC